MRSSLPNFLSVDAAKRCLDYIGSTISNSRQNAYTDTDPFQPLGSLGSASAIGTAPLAGRRDGIAPLNKAAPDIVGACGSGSASCEEEEDKEG